MEVVVIPILGCCFLSGLDVSDHHVAFGSAVHMVCGGV